MAAEPVLTVVEDYAEMSRRAADAIAESVRRHSEPAIAVPTGSTPLGLYDELVRRVRQGELDLAGAHFFCLDEYLGVSPDDPNSLTGWLLRSFVEPAGIDLTHLHMMPADDPDPNAGIARYTAALAALGGLELAVLGLGPNGHVAFNEPGSTVDSPTRIVELTSESRARNSEYWHGDVTIPPRAMTIGIAPLLQAKQIVLIVSGAGKAEILRETLEEAPSAKVPASWLRLAHDRLTVIADRAAAQDLGAAAANI